MSVAPDEVKVSSRDIAGYAWRSGIDAALSMPKLLLSAMFLSLVVGLGQAQIMPHLPPNLRQAMPVVPAGLIVGFIASLIRSFIQAPVAVAVHRFILLGETTSGIISLRPAHTRYFVAWLFLLHTFTTLLLLPRLVSHSAFAMFMTLSMIIVVAFVIVRGSLVFPAVAIDAGSQNWRDRLRDSLRQTSGHFWLIFLAVVLVTAPFFIVTTIIGFWQVVSIRHAGLSGPEFPPLLWPLTVYSVIIEQIYVVMAATVLSWAYKVLILDIKAGSAAH